MNREQESQIIMKQLEFTRIPPEAAVWRKVLSQGRRMDILKGCEVAVPHSEPQDNVLYFLDRGEVRLVRISLDGREKILWGLEAGSLLGETPLFDKLPPTSHVMAVTDCTLYTFSRRCVLEDILPRHPDLMLALFRSLASKVRVLCNQSVSLSLDNLCSRICKYLHLRRQGEGGKFLSCVNPGLNQQDLANLLGVHRVTLNKALRKLEKARILGPYSRDEVYLLDMEFFEKLVFESQ